MRAKLTDASVRKLSTSSPYLDVWDAGWRLSGSFGLRVWPSGRKAWRYLEFIPAFDAAGHQTGTRKKLHSLGHWPDTTLSEAIAAAEKIARRRHAGSGRTVSDLAERALAKLDAAGSAPATRATRASTLRLHVLPYVGKLRDREVTTRTLQELVDRQQLAGHLGSARDVLAALRMVFADSVSLGLEYNPAAALTIARHDRVRRVRSDTSTIARVWQAADAMLAEAMDQHDLDTAKWCLALQLQAATLQRTQHVLSLHRDQLDGDWWIHPGTVTAKSERAERTYRTKRGQEIAVPLVGLAREKVDQALALSPDPFPFGTGRPRLPERRYPPGFMADLRKRAGLDAKAWRPHDCRKIGATALDRMGIPLDHYQRVLTHTRPRSVTITAYVMPELRDRVTRSVLERWSDHLSGSLDAARTAATASR